MAGLVWLWQQPTSPPPPPPPPATDADWLTRFGRRAKGRGGAKS